MMNIEVENKGKSACQFDLEHKKKSLRKRMFEFSRLFGSRLFVGNDSIFVVFHDSSIHFSYSIYTSFHNQPTGMAPGMVNPKSSFSGTKVTEETRNMIRHFDERQKNLKVFCQDDDGLFSITPSSMKEGKRKSLSSNKESQKFKKKKLLHTEIDVC